MPRNRIVETDAVGAETLAADHGSRAVFSLIWPRESISTSAGCSPSISVFAGQEQQRATADCNGYVLVPLFRLLGRVAMVGRHVFVLLDHLMGGTYVHSSR